MKVRNASNAILHRATTQWLQSISSFVQVTMVMVVEMEMEMEKDVRKKS
jgi:hypothetical protein